MAYITLIIFTGIIFWMMNSKPRIGKNPPDSPYEL